MTEFPFEKAKNLLRLPPPKEERKYNSIEGGLDKYEAFFHRAKTWREKLTDVFHPTHKGIIATFLTEKNAKGAGIAYLDIAGGQSEAARSLLLTNKISTATVVNLTDLRTPEQQACDQQISLDYLLGNIFLRKTWNEIGEDKFDLITCCPIRGSQIKIPDKTSVFGQKVIPGELFAPILTRMIRCLAPGGLLLSQVPMQVYAEDPLEAMSGVGKPRLKRFRDWLQALETNDPSLSIRFFKDTGYYNLDPEFYWSLPKIFDCGVIRIERSMPNHNVIRQNQ